MDEAVELKRRYGKVTRGLEGLKSFVHDTGERYSGG